MVTHLLGCVYSKLQGEAANLAVLKLHEFVANVGQKNWVEIFQELLDVANGISQVVRCVARLQSNLTSPYFELRLQTLTRKYQSRCGNLASVVSKKRGLEHRNLNNVLGEEEDFAVAVLAKYHVPEALEESVCAWRCDVKLQLKEDIELDGDDFGVGEDVVADVDDLVELGLDNLLVLYRNQERGDADFMKLTRAYLFL